ncbi:MAG TPA: DUF1707 domain-containing protein [Streptosporangiaceae bacterium]
MSPQNPPTSSWTGNQSWSGSWGYQPRRRSPHQNPNLRVSDADRADVADRLSKHYGDGRLDQAEFNERMERAMSAKTQGDFAGLFEDLPDLAGGQTPPAQPPVSYQPVRRPSPVYRILMLVLLVVAAIILGHVLAQWFFPWVLIGIVAYLLLRRHERSHHRA